MNEHAPTRPADLPALQQPSHALIAAAFTDDLGAAKLVASIKEFVDAEAIDGTTKEGRERIRSRAADIRSAKAGFERVGKAMAADARKVPKAITDRNADLMLKMEAFIVEFRNPLTVFEDADKLRKAAHMDAIKAIAQPILTARSPVADIEARIAEIEAMDMGERWEEYRDDAVAAADARMEVLRATLSDAQVMAEAAALRAENARMAAESKEREEKIAAENKANADRLAAENKERDDKLAAERKANADRLAEMQAKSDAADAENAALKKAAADREDADIKAAEDREDVNPFAAVADREADAIKPAGYTAIAPDAKPSTSHGDTITAADVEASNGVSKPRASLGIGYPLPAGVTLAPLSPENITTLKMTAGISAPVAEPVVSNRNAVVTIQVTADSGYRYTATYRVSSDQWHRISAILAEVDVA
jgi:colicin import membrane protein